MEGFSEYGMEGLSELEIIRAGNMRRNVDKLLSLGFEFSNTLQKSQGNKNKRKTLDSQIAMPSRRSPRVYEVSSSSSSSSSSF